jgi:hypothetical protein
MDLRETRWEDVDWIGMVQDTDRWQALVNTVTNLLVAGNAGNFNDQLKKY